MLKNDQQTSSNLKIIQIRDGEINFACLKEKCPKSCCGPFGGVATGIEPVEERAFCEIFLTSEDAERIISAGYSNYIELSPEGRYRMKLHEDGSCTAYVNGLCEVHKIKPQICRAYPFYVDMFVGLCGATDCPGFGAGWTPLENLRGELKSTLNMYEHWLTDIHSVMNDLSDDHLLL